ncbi:Uncharacterised protein [Mycobacteroides abscessus subsp. massiliense]|nr:Uncharacterised protein [Mycobacteroides abscessus subsp. massiliense]
MKRGISCLAVSFGSALIGAGTGDGVWLLPAIIAAVVANWLFWGGDR